MANIQVWPNDAASYMQTAFRPGSEFQIYLGNRFFDANPSQKVVTAVARELTGFVWAIA
jgi:hypothetical protein